MDHKNINIGLKESVAEQKAFRTSFYNEHILSQGVKPTSIIMDQQSYKCHVGSEVADHVMMTIKDVQTLKALSGNPDVLAEDGLLEHSDFVMPTLRHVDIMNAGDKEVDKKEVSKSLCRAFQIYVYGNSRQVAEYEEILNKTYFPMSVPFYEYEKVEIFADQELLISAQANDFPVAIKVKELIFHDNGRLRIQCNVDITAETITHHGKKSLTPNLATGWNNGSSGEDGHHGLVPDSICLQNGGHGSSAGSGGSGENAMKCSCHVDSIEGDVVVSSAGGDGGNGGFGGDGSDGDYGGNGGGGGNGGNGGDGSVLTIYCAKNSENISILEHVSVGGLGGWGGRGGRSIDPHHSVNGPVGSNGKNGTPGKVVIVDS